MDDPFDRGRWSLPHLAVELEDLAARARPPFESVHPAGVDWAVDHLLDGVTPRELCEAAMWVGLRRCRTEGRGPLGLVTHSVLGAAACASVPTDDPVVAATAAVQHVAYTVGSYRGGANDDREGPHVLGWYDPDDASGDPVERFLEAAGAGECDLADHCWLSAVAADADRAEQALVSAGAAGYHLNEHKLVYPAQLRAWVGDGAPLDPVLFRAAARYAGNHLQDPLRAESRRADAAALAIEADERGGGVGPRGDLERVSVVATGIARTNPKDLTPLLMGSLSEGLAPEDLVHAVSLVGAARFASTTFDHRGPVGALHSGTGTNAVRRCLERAASPESRYELAICSTESPRALHLAPLGELSTPHSDDEALEDMVAAIRGGDPDAAAEAASAVPVDDGAAVERAWAVVFAAVVRDQWMLLHGIKHAVAMHEDFGASGHPARIWYLAAAARTAAHAAAAEQPVAAEVARRLG